MVGFFNRAEGVAECVVRGTLPQSFLNKCIAMGIELHSVESLDPYSIKISAGGGSLKKLRAAAGRTSCELEVVRRGGALSLGRILLRRAFPAALAALLLAGVLCSRFFIWDISVEGNETVSAGKILDTLEQCGVAGGSFWPNLTSDNLRSEVLVLMPELSWITVNISGSRAHVIVRERVAKPEMIDEDEPRDIIAEKTGFIMNLNALAGSAEVKRGQAVNSGDILISGIMESSFSPPRLVHAWGDVTAQTFYELNAVMPGKALVKDYTGEKKERWALVIGKNRYNFYTNSSIDSVNCDKIVSEWKLEAEGLFSLPVKLVKETSVFYELREEPRDALMAGKSMLEGLKEDLNAVIGDSGAVLEQHSSVSDNGGLLNVCLRAVCSENIALSVPFSGERTAEYLRMKGNTNDGENDRG